MNGLKGKYYWVKTPAGIEVAFKRDSGKWELCGINNDEDCKDAILEIYMEVANEANKEQNQALHKHIVMPMFADDSNLGNEKRTELINNYKNKMPEWEGNYSQGFADCFNWLLREYEKAN